MTNLWNKITELSKRKLISITLVLLALFAIFRACHGPILQEHVYYILRSNSFAPIELYGKEPNMSAFVDDLMATIAENEKFKLHLSVSKNLSITDLFKMLDSGEYDAILVTFSPADYLKNKYYISQPIYNAGPVLVVNADSEAKSLKDLQGKPIAIKRGSSQIFQLGRETSFFVPYDNMITALNDLNKNIIAGVILEAEIAQIYAHDFFKEKIKIATAPLTDLGLRLVAKKGKLEENLILMFNQGLENAEKNGVFEDLIHKWNLANP